jgi:hypothetical protein
MLARRQLRAVAGARQEPIALTAPPESLTLDRETDRRCLRPGSVRRQTGVTW